MARPEMKLSSTERGELERWQGRLERADRQWQARREKIDQQRDEVRRQYAAWVRKVGLSAAAREIGVSKSALDQRLRNMEGKRKAAG